MISFRFNSLRPLLLVERLSIAMSQTAGMQTFQDAPKKRDIEWPEKNRLPVVPKVPQYAPSQRPFKMQKRLRYLRGPEPIHTELIHKQFGIVAVMGGRMRPEHFEMVRLVLIRRCDFTKMFAVWRIDNPWQPITKKGRGHQMGGGKGPIDHYATPVKAGRVVLEIGGDIEYCAVERILTNIANKMPFKSIATNYEKMEEDRKLEAKLENDNLNPYTWKYIIQNNMGGCHNWISPSDKKWFGKHL